MHGLLHTCCRQLGSAGLLPAHLSAEGAEWPETHGSKGRKALSQADILEREAGGGLGARHETFMGAWHQGEEVPQPG